MYNHLTQGRSGWRALRRAIAPAVVAVSAVALTGALHAQDATSAESALINKLLKKGILSSQDAQELQTDLQQEATTQSSASKIVLAAPVTELKLYGDLRMRYNYQSIQFQAPPTNVGTSLPIFTANTSGKTSQGHYYQTTAGTFAPLPKGAVNSAGVVTFPKNAAGKTLYTRVNTPQVDPSGFQQSRERFRLRLDADIKLGDNWFAGVELGTGQAADSGNQTFGDTGTSTGAFGKYNIYISKAFFGWHNDWATLVAGKFSNPFYTTDLVWDPDVNPDGVYESIAFHKLFGGGAAGPTGGDGKDGKDKVVAPTESGLPWELTLNLGEFVLQDNQEGGLKGTAPSYLTASGATIPTTGAPVYGTDSDLKTDAWLFETQLIGSYKFNNGVKVTFAPGWLFESAATVSGSAGTVNFNDTTLVSGSTRNLNILLAPGDVSFKIGRVPAKFFWDFAYNVDGRKREENTYLLPTTTDPNNPAIRVQNWKVEDNFAYLVGFQVGENRKAGDFSLLVNWRQTGIAAVDPNLNDSDFAEGFLNTRGIKAVASYNFADFVVGSVTYMWANNIRKNLVGGEATTDNAIANMNSSNVLFVDLSIKF